MKKVRVLTAEEAALLVNDGDTIATGGFVSCACPEALSKALEKRFLETGHPRDLTLFFAAGQGHRDGTGGDHYGHEGMVKRVIGGHWDRAPKLGDLALSNKIEAYNLPQGVISHMYRDIAAHNIGTITHVGLYPFAEGSFHARAAAYAIFFGASATKAVTVIPYPPQTTLPFPRGCCPAARSRRWRSATAGPLPLPKAPAEAECRRWPLRAARESRRRSVQKW